MTATSLVVAPAPGMPARLFLALPRISLAWAYTLRVLLAVSIAMYTAYWLELDSPFSAGTTVLVVMNASRGAIISKSVWRLAGSIVGATAAVVLVALFAQAPVLFILGLGAWLGLCTFTASLLRYNRSYGAVLAGYTVTLVAFGAIGDPGRIFELATARVAVVTIGIISSALVFLVTDRGPGRAALEKRVAGLIAASASVLYDALRFGDFDQAALARRKMATDLIALDQVVEFAGAEDASLGRYQSDLRVALAEIFAALTGGLHTVELVRQAAPDEAATLEQALEVLANASNTAPAAGLHDTVQAAIAALRAAAAECRSIPSLAALDQSIELLLRFDMALGSLQALQDDVPRATLTRLRNFVNPVTAWRNGLRAALAITMAGLFWIISQWPNGASMLAYIGPVTALVSQSESAAQASVDFFKGTILATLAAFVCTYAILPQMTGFPLLMVAMLPFIAAGVMASRNPRHGVVALGFLVFFVTFVAPNNPMHYDLAASVNTYLAFIVGGACGVFAFRIVLPPNPIAEARVLAHALRNDVQRLAALRTPPHMLAWDHLQHQKIVRLSRRLARFPVQQTAAVASGVAAIVIGRHVAALRLAERDTSLPPGARTSAAQSADSFRRVLAFPGRTIETIQTETAKLDTADAPQAVLHLLAVLHDLARLMAENLDFFARNSPLPDRTS